MLVSFFDRHLIVSLCQVHFDEKSCCIQSIKKIFYPREWMVIFFTLLVQSTVVYPYIKGIIVLLNKNYKGTVGTSEGVDAAPFHKPFQLPFHLIKLSLDHSIQLRLQRCCQFIQKIYIVGSLLLQRNARLRKHITVLITTHLLACSYRLLITIIACIYGKTICSNAAEIYKLHNIVYFPCNSVKLLPWKLFC